MKRVSWVAWGVALLLSTSSQAATDLAGKDQHPYFVSCEDAFRLNDFSSLKKYLDDDVPDSCFRMNKYEYLYLYSNSGKGLVYWNAKTNETDSELDRAQLISVEAEMQGQANKRFVLIKTGWAGRGEAIATYKVFHLVPKTNENHSYQLEDLIQSDENPISGLCGDWNDIHSGNLYQPGLNKIEKATAINKYTILNEGTSALKISFDVTEQDCKTLKKTNLIRTFRIGDGSFKEIASH